MKKILLLAFAVVLGAAAAPPALLTPADLDPTQILSPPPARDSAREAAEIAELNAIAAQATPDELAAATRDANDQTGAFYAPVLGPNFDLARLPATAHLLADIGAADESVGGAAK